MTTRTIEDSNGKAWYEPLTISHTGLFHIATAKPAILRSWDRKLKVSDEELRHITIHENLIKRLIRIQVFLNRKTWVRRNGVCHESLGEACLAMAGGRAEISPILGATETKV